MSTVPEIDDPALMFTSVRERSKNLRQQRILQGAREQFSKFGYDDATLRGIAEAAGLSVSTLFNYVSHKRDLIFLIFNEEIDTLIEKAMATTRPWKSFRENVLCLTDPQFELFAADPVLSRILLTEILLETPGRHLGRYLSVRLRVLQRIEALVVAAQNTGELRLQLNPEMVARHTFLSFTAALRWWIMEPAPEARAGKLEYAAMLETQLEGLADRSVRSLPPSPSGHPTRPRGNG